MPIVEKPEMTELVPIPQLPTPMTLLEVAVKRGSDIDTIERLVKLQIEMQQQDAKVLYGQAMKRAQGAMTRVSVDATNPETHSKYASYAQLDRALRPIYSREGFALSFDTEDSPLPESVRVVCYVTHEAGFTKTHRIDMPADGKGPKGGAVMTKTHATGAAATYGMRYLLKMIFNVAVGEDDNDGNGVQSSERLEEGLVVERLTWIKEARDIEELQRTFKNAYKMAEAGKDKAAMAQFIAAKDARKKELQ